MTPASDFQMKSLLIRPSFSLYLLSSPLLQLQQNLHWDLILVSPLNIACFYFFSFDIILIRVIITWKGVIDIVSKCYGICVWLVELHGKHAVLRDDFDSNLLGELDSSVW